jgi:hypothetical protein
VSEARLLLRDWLVIFTANYHRNSFMRASAAQLLQLPVRHTALSMHACGARMLAVSMLMQPDAAAEGVCCSLPHVYAYAAASW